MRSIIESLNQLSPVHLVPFWDDQGDIYWRAVWHQAEIVPEVGWHRNFWGMGETPEQAVMDLWQQITDANTVCINTYPAGRLVSTLYRWTGQGWETVVYRYDERGKLIGFEKCIG